MIPAEAIQLMTRRVVVIEEPGEVGPAHQNKEDDLILFEEDQIYSPISPLLKITLPEEKPSTSSQGSALVGLSKDEIARNCRKYLERESFGNEPISSDESVTDLVETGAGL